MLSIFNRTSALVVCSSIYRNSKVRRHPGPKQEEGVKIATNAAKLITSHVSWSYSTSVRRVRQACPKRSFGDEKCVNRGGQLIHGRVTCAEI